VIRQCPVSGYTCGNDPDSGISQCLTRPNGAKTCVGQGLATCDGDFVQVCDGKMLSEFDCSAIGGTCVLGEGPPRCARPNETCTPFDLAVNQCHGSRIDLCVAGSPTSFDCASIGQRCVASGTQRAVCAP
jgi:hypothetical protein